jgi:D-alanine-D-alanine ligase-like ATP-grasp enzyme
LKGMHTVNTAEKSLRLALVFGGRSGEHEVSVVSARSVAGALDADRYLVVPMAIARDGRWTDPDTARRVLEGSGDRTDKVARFDGSHRLDPRLLDGSIDVVLPILHGPYGEDGTIQGMLEMLDLPYVGCDVTSSAVCMDKILCKRLLREAGLATPQWREVDRHRWDTDRSRLRDLSLELGLPLFVKPARLGSSMEPSRAPSGTTNGRSSSRASTLARSRLRYSATPIHARRYRARSFPGTSSTTTTTSTSMTPVSFSHRRRWTSLSPRPPGCLQ